MAGLRGGNHRPLDYAPGSLDQEPVLAVNPTDGSVMAAWGYWERGEYSIAIAVKTGESWSDPVFIGRDDGMDQIDPALVFDQHGIAYLAFSTPSVDQVRITAITGEPGGEILPPRAISPAGINSGMPALQVVGNRLVVAFRTGATITLLDLPLFPTGSQADETVSTQSIGEGPDAVDPLSWVYDGGDQESTDDNNNDRRESDESTDADWLVPLEQR